MWRGRGRERGSAGREVRHSGRRLRLRQRERSNKRIKYLDSGTGIPAGSCYDQMLMPVVSITAGDGVFAIVQSVVVIGKI